MRNVWTKRDAGKTFWREKRVGGGDFKREKWEKTLDCEANFDRASETPETYKGHLLGSANALLGNTDVKSRFHKCFMRK